MKAGNGEKERKKKGTYNTNKMVEPNPNISITVLNANGLNVYTSIKRRYQNGFFK